MSRPRPALQSCVKSISRGVTSRHILLIAVSLAVLVSLHSTTAKPRTTAPGDHKPPTTKPIIRSPQTQHSHLPIAPETSAESTGTQRTGRENDDTSRNRNDREPSELFPPPSKSEWASLIATTLLWEMTESPSQLRSIMGTARHKSHAKTEDSVQQTTLQRFAATRTFGFSGPFVQKLKKVCPKHCASVPPKNRSYFRAIAAAQRLSSASAVAEAVTTQRNHRAQQFAEFSASASPGTVRPFTSFSSSDVAIGHHEAPGEARRSKIYAALNEVPSFFSQPSMCKAATINDRDPSTSTAARQRHAALHTPYSALPTTNGEHKDRTDDTEGNRAPKKLPLVLCALGRRFFGRGGQEYVWEAIRQWRVFHPSHEQVPGESRPGDSPDGIACTQRYPIYLIMNKTIAATSAVRGNASFYDVTVVHEQSIPRIPQWDRYLDVFYPQGVMHPGGSKRTGHLKFNQHISERFVALAAFLFWSKLEHVVHMENDMMMYGKMDRVFAAAWDCGAPLATTFPHTKGAIPGQLYIRNFAAILDLVEFINDLLSCGEDFGRAMMAKKKDYANDMTYLMNYFQVFGHHRIQELPCTPFKAGQNCIADTWARQGVAHFSNSSPSRAGENRENEATTPTPMKRVGFFDGASFGQWYSFAVKDHPPKSFDAVTSGGGGPGEENKNHHDQTDEHRDTTNAETANKDSTADHEKCRSKSAHGVFIATAARGHSGVFHDIIPDAKRWAQWAQQSARKGEAVSAMRPPEHIRNSMGGRFLDATPRMESERLMWAADAQGRRVPIWRGVPLLSLHVHAKNLQWFRSQ